MISWRQISRYTHTLTGRLQRSVRVKGDDILRWRSGDWCVPAEVLLWRFRLRSAFDPDSCCARDEGRQSNSDQRSAVPRPGFHAQFRLPSKVPARGLKIPVGENLISSTQLGGERRRLHRRSRRRLEKGPRPAHFDEMVSDVLLLPGCQRGIKRGIDREVSFPPD
jgi:hypothetical protein